MARLFICLLICLAMAIHSQAYSSRNSELRRFMEEFFRDAPEKKECESWEDWNPHSCADFVAMDKGYCKDHPLIAKVACKRSCSPCGPKQKSQSQTAICEDKMPDCRARYERWSMSFDGQDACTELPAYSHENCRAYCNLCRNGRV